MRLKEWDELPPYRFATVQEDIIIMTSGLEVLSSGYGVITAEYWMLLVLSAIREAYQFQCRLRARASWG